MADESKQIIAVLSAEPQIQRKLQERRRACIHRTLGRAGLQQGGGKLLAVGIPVVTRCSSRRVFFGLLLLVRTPPLPVPHLPVVTVPLVQPLLRMLLQPLLLLLLLLPRLPLLLPFLRLQLSLCPLPQLRLLTLLRLLLSLRLLPLLPLRLLLSLSLLPPLQDSLKPCQLRH